jgi:hypothetical protein
MIYKKIPYNLDKATFPIVDNEICNDISVPKGKGDWKYKEGDIICVSIFSENSIIVCLRTPEDSLAKYKQKVKSLLDKHSFLYAFNRNMEFGNFQGFLKKEYKIIEIKAFKGAGKNKDWFFEELIKNKLIPSDLIPSDPLKSGEEILKKYAEKDYESIIAHNVADVIKQHYILKFQKFFLENYRINSQGWIEE